MVSWSQQGDKQANDNGDPLAGLLAATLSCTQCSTVKTKVLQSQGSRPSPLTADPHPNPMLSEAAAHLPRCHTLSPPLSPPGLRCIRPHALTVLGTESASCQRLLRDLAL